MEKYIEAIQSGNWGVYHEAVKKEASRQVGLMDRWLKDAKKFGSQDLKEFPFLEDPIEKSIKYRYRIYNGNKAVKEIDRELVHLNGLLVDPDTFEEERTKATERVKELLDEKADIESEQYMLSGRILKIYFAVNGYVVLVQEKEKETYPDG